MAEQIAQQKHIFDFSKIERKASPVKSATTEKIYYTDARPNHESCQCAFFKQFGMKRGPCRHILEKKLELANDKLFYFTNREQYDSRAFFRSVEQVSEYYEFTDNPEFNHICALWLSRMFLHGTATSDDIYFLVNGEFRGSAKILGTTILSLSRRGLAITTGIRIRTQRPECHGRRVEQWKLTEKGTALLESIHKVG